MRGAAGLVALAALAAAVAFGYLRGAADYRADYQARELAQIEAFRKLEAARIEALRARDELSRQLEEKAHADPVAVPRCLGPRRVRRLNALR